MRRARVWLGTPRPVRPGVVVALAAVIGLQALYIVTTPRNDSTSMALWGVAALAAAGASIYSLDRERRQGTGATPTALYLALLSVLLLQIALLFAAESVYGFLWKVFK